ncbi:MAG: DUF1223 domain-containing protein [Pseudomonadota bacterium]|nr:DUF1223 domain-containing protein [Pseudomonadota bacterium]
MLRFRSYLALLAMLLAAWPSEAAAPVVLELFTSQGCSSCPQADALLQRLAKEDATLLPLSLHVHYWDHLGWKDPYSSPANTLRQKTYTQALGGWRIYTPELVVNGQIAAIGSDEYEVRNAIADARLTPAAADVTISRASVGGFNVTISNKGRSPIKGTFDVLALGFEPYAKTQVEAGENRGHRLENINNVTSIQSLGTWTGGETRYTVPASGRPGEGMAILVQFPQQGRILGFASYLPASATSGSVP